MARGGVLREFKDFIRTIQSDQSGTINPNKSK